MFFGDSPCPPLEFLLQGGNIFFDLCVHDVDYIRWALRDEVDSVYATANYSCRELETHQVYDNATMVLKFTKGAVVTLNLSRWSCYGYDQRCEIFGDGGLICVRSQHQNSTILYNQKGEHHSLLKNSYDQRFKQAFYNEIDSFVDTIMNGKEWMATKDDVIAVQRIAQAANRSCELDCVVHISTTAGTNNNNKATNYSYVCEEFS